jgi:hypothetical protein
MDSNLLPEETLCALGAYQRPTGPTQETFPRIATAFSKKRILENVGAGYRSHFSRFRSS